MVEASSEEENFRQLQEKVDELEDLQLLEKLNSIELREEIENIRNEMESLGMMTPEGVQATKDEAGKAPGYSDLYDRVISLEKFVNDTLSEMSAASGDKKSLKSLKDDLEKKIQEEVDERLKGVSKQKEEKGGFFSRSKKTEVDWDKVRSIVEEETDKILSEKKLPKGDVDTSVIEEKFETKIDERVSSLRKEIDKASRPWSDKDVEKMLDEVKENVTKAALAELKDNMKINPKKMEKRVKEIEEEFDSYTKERKKFLETVEEVEDRTGKMQKQMTEVLDTIPKEVKKVEKEMDEKIGDTDDLVSSLSSDLRKIQSELDEYGDKSFVTKEELKELVDSKYTELKNDFLAERLREENTDEKFENIEEEIDSIKTKFKSWRVDVGLQLEKLEDVKKDYDSLKMHLDSYVNKKLAKLDVDLLEDLSERVVENKERLEDLNQKMGDVAALENQVGKNKDDIGKLMKLVKLEMDRIKSLGSDMNRTVMEKIKEFEQGTTENQLLNEVHNLESRLLRLEEDMKRLSSAFRNKSVSQPTVIE